MLLHTCLHVPQRITFERALGRSSCPASLAGGGARDVLGEELGAGAEEPGELRLLEELGAGAEDASTHNF